MSAPQTQIISAPATILASRQQLLASASAMQRVAVMPAMLNAMDKNEVRKVFVKNIAEDIPDSFVESLLRVGFVFLLSLDSESYDRNADKY